MWAFLPFLALGHNGVVHTPQASSCIMVGISMACSRCYCIYNYGMNFVHHRVDGQTQSLSWNSTHFPIAVAVTANSTVWAVADIGTEFVYIVDGVRVTPPGCPSPETSKIYNWNGSLVMFGLETGTATEILQDNTCSIRPEWSWNSSLWPSVWGGKDVNTESPIFYGAMLYDNCVWYTTRRDNVRLESPNCQKISDPVNDVVGDTIHEGGEFVITPKHGLLWLNGEGSTKRGSGSAATSQDDAFLAGKILDVDTDTAAVKPIAAGFRHPWTAVVVDEVLVVADVQSYIAEEVTEVAVSSIDKSNFGWPLFEADVCVNPAMVPPPSMHAHFRKPTLVFRRTDPTTANIIAISLLAAVILAAATVRIFEVQPIWWWATVLTAAISTYPIWYTVRSYKGGLGPYGSVYYRGSNPVRPFLALSVAGLVLAVIVRLRWVSIFSCLYTILIVLITSTVVTEPYGPSVTAWLLVASSLVTIGLCVADRLFATPQKRLYTSWF